MSKISSSPLHDGLVFKKRVVRWFFKSFDSLKNLCSSKAICPIPLAPSKILVSNLGNLGDVIIASSAIHSLQSAYPNAEIGFLVSSHARAAIELIPEVKFVHVFEHFYQAKNPYKAALHHWKRKRAMVQEIRDCSYDMAIDLQPFFPNALPIFYAAKIPVRLGYISGGFGSLLTHPFVEADWNQYLGKMHLQQLLNQKIPLKQDLKEVLFAGNMSYKLPSRYVLVHMCASKKEKELKREWWIQLILKLKKIGVEVVLTGRGNRDQQECNVVSKQTGCMNVCNQLTLSEYGALCQGAALLITVDSMAVHLGALVKIPIMVLFARENNPSLWFPSMNGCQAVFMSELKNSVDEVYGRAIKFC